MDAFASALGGCGLALAVARFFILRALGDLDDLSTKVHHISENLAAIAVRMEQLAEHDSSIREHAKKLAYLEGITKK
jgi:hypothetical protein